MSLKMYAQLTALRLMEQLNGDDSWVFPVEVEDFENGHIDYLTIPDFLIKYRIHIRSTNQAHIISPKRIQLGLTGV